MRHLVRQNKSRQKNGLRRPGVGHVELTFREVGAVIAPIGNVPGVVTLDENEAGSLDGREVDLLTTPAAQTALHPKNHSGRSRRDTCRQDERNARKRKRLQASGFREIRAKMAIK
jgi:hypothetical protein